MSKFSAFMAQNVAKIENKKVIISDRFKDKNGNPIAWEIKAITCEENEALQRRSMVQVPVAGQRGAFTREMDNIKYTTALLCASVVYPELDDAELQDSYGVKTPEALLKAMLYPSEETKLAEQVMSLSKLETMNDLVDEAKN